MSPVSRPTALVLLALFTGIGGVLRFLGLDWQSLWLDEVSSLRNAHAFGRGGLEALARADQIAPLHSIVLWMSTSVLGDTSFAVRLPSVIAGILTIPLIYAVAMRMFGSRPVALISAGLVAISPFAIWFSQEGRMYALLLLASLAYVAVVWPIVWRNLTWRELIGLAVITAIGLGMHHYMALLSISFGLFLLVKDRTITCRSLVWGATQIAAALVFSYWMLLTADTLDNTAGNPKAAFFLWAPYAFYTFVAGFSYGPSTRELALAGNDIVHTALADPLPVLILGLATMVLLWFGIRRALASRDRLPVLWLGIWLGVPVILAVLATFATNISFNVRYIIISFPPLMMGIALGLAELRWPSVFAFRRLRTSAGGAGRVFAGWENVARLAAAIVLAVCLSIATVNLYDNPRYAKADARSLAAFVKGRSPRDLLVTDNYSITKMLHFYNAPAPGEAMQVDYRNTAKSPGQVWKNVRRMPPGAADEIWLIEYRSWEADPHHFLRKQLDRSARLVEVRNWPGVALRRYRPRRG